MKSSEPQGNREDQMDVRQSDRSLKSLTSIVTILRSKIVTRNCGNLLKMHVREWTRSICQGPYEERKDQIHLIQEMPACASKYREISILFRQYFTSLFWRKKKASSGRYILQWRDICNSLRALGGALARVPKDQTHTDTATKNGISPIGFWYVKISIHAGEMIREIRNNLSSIGLYFSARVRDKQGSWWKVQMHVGQRIAKML